MPEKNVRHQLSSERDSEFVTFFLNIFKEYAQARAQDRIRHRTFALETLRDLSGLLRLSTTLELSMGRIEFTLTQVARRVTADQELYLLSFEDAGFNGTDLQSVRLTIMNIHRGVLEEVQPKLPSIANRYRSNRLRFRWFGRSSSQFEYYTHLLRDLSISLNNIEQQFEIWRRIQPVEVYPTIYYDHSPAEIIERVKRDSTEPANQKLRDVYNALAVACHDYTNVDLRGATLANIPLNGVRWSPQTTLWPKTWFEGIRDSSIEVEPGVFEVKYHSHDASTGIVE